MYENKRDPLASKNKFVRRVVKNLTVAVCLLLISLLIGVLGYHYTADIEWLDALHNASMILSGMGPVVEIKTINGKWFSSIYAIFCGVAFITNISIVLAPLAHRFFHILHLEEDN